MSNLMEWGNSGEELGRNWAGIGEIVEKSDYNQTKGTLLTQCPFLC